MISAQSMPLLSNGETKPSLEKADFAARVQGLSPAQKREFLAQLMNQKGPRERVAPLSHAQQRLWFLEHIVRGNAFYNECSALRFLVPIDKSALEKSLNEIVRRHEALRTNIESTDGAPQQRVLAALPIALREVRLESTPVADREGEAIRIANEEAVSPFDLSQAPLFRVLLIGLGHNDHILVLTVHHIVCDGWSMKIFFDELKVLYEAYSAGRAPLLPPLTIQYVDFTLWQRERLQGGMLEGQLEFWRKHLAGLSHLQLPTDRPRPLVPAFSGGREPLSIAPHVYRAFLSLCDQTAVTPFMALLAAYQVLLQRYSGQDDVAVGCPTANRNRPELEQLIGFFVNTLVMRTSLAGDPTFHDVLARVREVALGAYANQDIPFEKLVEELHPERDQSRNPLFQVTFQFLNVAAVRVSEDVLRSFEVAIPTSKFDLRCDLWTAGGGLGGYLEYSSDLFEAETVRAMCRKFELLLERLVLSPEARISEVPLLEDEERRLLDLWNAAARSTPNQAWSADCVHEGFERQAERYPDRIAIGDGKTTLSYAELNARANQLAHFLRGRGVINGSLVALLINPSSELVIAELAVLKAGGAYVPLDPASPPARINAMVQEAMPRIVLTAERYQNLVPSYCSKVRLDADWDQIADNSDANLSVRVDARSLAYAIFTSGSTGAPRCVEVQHGALNNLVAWHRREYQITPEDRAVLYASPAFDASVWETWPYLEAGASVHVPPEDIHLVVEGLAQWFVANEITICFLPTPMAESFVRLSPPPRLRLRALLTGGDQLRAAPLTSLPFRFVNHYGPTENAVVATCCDVVAGTLGPPPIGRPIGHVQTYILDARMQPVPIGFKGELYLGGTGLARGYLGQSELTRDRFVPHPFDPRPGARLYRTGDVARFRRDGNIEFHGRVDAQIKVRGFRVEPAEIESALDSNPLVERSLVGTYQSPVGETLIRAFVVPRKVENGTGLESCFIGEWRTTYEQVYGKPCESPDFNIVGWESSYTGEALSEEEMREQVDGTVGRIRALGASRVLEIGCGTGLLLLSLAGECQRYVGTDFSEAAVAQTGEAVKRRGWGQVELWHRQADDFSGIEPGQFDAVVLNSVVQYFPSVEYLLRVLEGSLRALRPGGRIFVGDVRSLESLELLHMGIEWERAGAQGWAGQVRERAERRRKQEQELVIEAEFFEALREARPEIAGVAVELRRGWRHNELTRFRYDVVLQAGGEVRELENWEERPWKGKEELREYLRQESPAALRVRGIPNQRLMGEKRKLDWLGTVESDTAIGGWESQGEDGVEPEEMWALSGELPYEVRLEWSEAVECFDALLVRRGGESGMVRLAARERRERKPWSAYASEPMSQPAHQNLAQTLRNHLRERLPEYMIPASFVWMDAMPLTRTGKLDRRALPAPVRGGEQPDSGFVPPQTDSEKRVASVWSEVLGVERPGIHGNFFNLGGHSLMATQVISRLSYTFGFEIPLRQIFERPTIAGLATAIDAMGQQERLRVMTPILPVREDMPAHLQPDQMSDEEVESMLAALVNAGGLE